MRSRDDIPATLGELRYGTIASVDLASARCTVAAGDLTSGPVRWIEVRAGATRTWSPPTIGEQVLLICPEGDLAAGIVLRGIFSAANPPAGNSLRELIEFADGAVLAYDPQAQHLDIALPAGATVAIVGDVAITGKLVVSETIAAAGDVTGDGVSLAHHLHGQVQAGGAKTGQPE